MAAPLSESPPIAAVLAPIVLVVTRRREALAWIAVSLGVSALGLFFAFLFLVGAALNHCNGVCLS